MPALAGWWTFGIEHVLFGTVLGLVFLARGRANNHHARTRREPEGTDVGA